MLIKYFLRNCYWEKDCSFSFANVFLLIQNNISRKKGVTIHFNDFNLPFPTTLLAIFCWNWPNRLTDRQADDRTCTCTPAKSDAYLSLNPFRWVCNCLSWHIIRIVKKFMEANLIDLFLKKNIILIKTFRLH